MVSVLVIVIGVVLVRTGGSLLVTGVGLIGEGLNKIFNVFKKNEGE